MREDRILKSGVATLATGCGLLIPASIGLLISGVPTVLSPLPVLTVLSTFLFSSRAVAVVIPPLFFFMWNPRLFRGESKLPKRSYGLLIVAAILNVIWFIVGWKNGLHYQGTGYVYKVAAITVAWVALLGTVFARYWRRESSFSLNLILHWLLFAWLAWYAFPYLGELP